MLEPNSHQELFAGGLDPLRIRPAHLEDAPAMNDILLEGWDSAGPDMAGTPYALERQAWWRAHGVAEHERLIRVMHETHLVKLIRVARLGSTAVGFICARDEFPQMWIDYLGVKKDMWGQGIGGRILDDFLDIADNVYGLPVYAHVVKGNRRSESLASRGFRPVQISPSGWELPPPDVPHNITVARREPYGK